MGYGYDWRPYVSVGERRRLAEREIAALKKKGAVVSPVVIQGRTIARTFWGKAWCDNLMAYSDFENRLPRGARYVRNGYVVDLQIESGRVRALVQGSELYKLNIEISPVRPDVWDKIVTAVSGKIDSVVELLAGQLSTGVMTMLSLPEKGLFPSPSEIRMDCSCPDSADLCKHLAAALYGVGARLDLQPELLFRLRKADPADLVTAAGRGLVASLPAARGHEVLAGDDLGAVFGIELETAGPGPLAAAAKPALAGRRSKVAAPRAASPRVPKKPVAAPAKSPVPLSPLPKLRGFTPRVLTRVELSSLGASAATVREWLAAGYLIGTDRNATYYTTPRLGMELERLQARGKKGRRRCLRRKRPRERPSLAPIEGTSAPRGR